jgi:hypothetical protein
VDYQLPPTRKETGQPKEQVYPWTRDKEKARIEPTRKYVFKFVCLGFGHDSVVCEIVSVTDPYHHGGLQFWPDSRIVSSFCGQLYQDDTDSPGATKLGKLSLPNSK